MFTCSKLFENLPAAHRQHNHEGHCALIHGHNWAFELTFASEKGLDLNGFVVDFGKLKFVRRWLEEKFDHTLLLNEDDPYLEELKTDLQHDDWNGIAFAKIVVVPNCGAEELARYVQENVTTLLAEHGLEHIKVCKVVCFEDTKNHATYAI